MLVQYLGQEGPLEEEMATYSNIIVWRIPMDRGPRQATIHKELDTTEPLSMHALCMNIF